MFRSLHYLQELLAGVPVEASFLALGEEQVEALCEERSSSFADATSVYFAPSPPARA